MIQNNLIKPKVKTGLNLFINSLNKWRNDLNIKKDQSHKIITNCFRRIRLFCNVKK